ncbi:MAG: hypothetical protein CGW95_14060 [Phenylobacterium zucineum]|nr:MAG: hypothetical protein CGW95_14060 [Phenylobacterium zucineum]
MAAATQDAVSKIGDIVFESKTRRLTLSMNRYRWEGPGGERVRSALQIGSVLEVKTRRLRRSAKDAVLELLSLDFTPGEAPGGLLTLRFAGGGDLAVKVECVDAVLADLSQPWPTSRVPKHDMP